MSSLKAIIIDDENAAIGYLKKLIEEFTPQVQVICTASNALEAVKKIKSHPVDLIFCDIEMPGGTGFDFLEAIDSINYKIIFTTAYDAYALKAFKMKADGYLMKPIDVDDLEDLVEKFMVEKVKPGSENNTVLSFRTQESVEFVKSQDVIRIKGEGNYSTIFVKNGQKIVVSKNLKQLQEQLPVDSFLKTHKSHIINPTHIVRFIKTAGGYFEMIDQSTVPVSRRKKETILKQLTSK